MKLIMRLLPYMLAVPRSLFYCIRLFGLNGLKFPLIVANSVKMRGVKRGSIELKDIKPFQIRIGFEGTPYISANKSIIMIDKKGKIIFCGRATFRPGISICVEDAVLEIGRNLNTNRNILISCAERITIGDNVFIGWNTSIKDYDGHGIICDGVLKPARKPVTIGDHVWLAAYVDILKGVSIPPNCVVAYRSCVTKPVDEGNVLIAGHPAKIVQRNIDWQYDM